MSAIVLERTSSGFTIISEKREYFPIDQDSQGLMKSTGICAVVPFNVTVRVVLLGIWPGVENLVWG